MTISGISSTDSFAGSAAQGPQNLNKDAFMKLLVSQLQHQDPLSPVTNEDFVAQLATFSSLEQLEGLNQNIIGMIALNQSNALLSQLTQSSDLIGKEVTWQDFDTQATQSGVVESVKIVDGLAVLSIAGQDVPLVAVIEVEGQASDAAPDESSVEE
jgi:flagellar basal-body rod modification protein FlgD